MTEPTPERNRRAPSVAPRKNPTTGLWEFIVDLGPGADPGGVWRERRQARRRGFATKAAAQEALDDLRGKARTGTFTYDSKLTVAGYLREWLSDTLPATVRPATLFSYEQNLERHVMPRIGDMKLKQLTGPALNRLYGQLLAPGANLRSPKRGLSPRTVQYIHTVLHRALKDAVRHGLLQSNPADLADPPPSTAVQKAGLKVWTGAELAAFLQQSEAEGDRDHPLWRLIAATGMRRGEALGLRWADVDLGAGTATVTRTLIIVDHVAQFGQPKTAAGARTIALDERTTAALRSHRARRAAERLSLGQGQASSDELAFADTSGDWLHPEAVSKRFDRRANRYGLPHIGVHGLRHTWATLALRAGVHPRIVQQRLGHSTIAVTLGVYSHVTDGMDLGAAQQVAALFEPTVTNL